MKFLRLSPFPHRQKHSGAKSILYGRYFAQFQNKNAIPQQGRSFQTWKGGGKSVAFMLRLPFLSGEGEKRDADSNPKQFGYGFGPRRRICGLAPQTQDVPPPPPPPPPRRGFCLSPG